MVEKKDPQKTESKRFYKSRKDKMIDGVCGGLAEYLNVDVNVIRILWLISIFLKGLGIVAYILAMIIVPVNPAHRELKEEEKKKRNPVFFWGLLLIIIGFLIQLFYSSHNYFIGFAQFIYYIIHFSHLLFP